MDSTCEMRRMFQVEDSKEEGLGKGVISTEGGRRADI